MLAIIDSVLGSLPRLPLSLDALIAEAKRRMRRRRLLTLLVLAAGVAVVAAVLELPSGTGSGVAAVNPKPVVHVVLEQPPTSVSFNLRTGHKTGGLSREEMWLDRRNGRVRVVDNYGGHVIGDDVWKSHYTPTSEAAAVEHIYRSLSGNYPAALKNGADKVVGRGTFNGHRLYWLQLRQTKLPAWRNHHPWPQAAANVGVDARTYKPIILRFGSSRGRSGGFYVPVLTAEAIPYDPTDFKSRGPYPRPGSPQTHQPATGFAFGSADLSARAGATVRAPWLTAGTTVAGLKLRAITPFTISRSKHHFSYGAPRPKSGHGLALIYGPPSYKATPTIPTRINVYGKGPRQGAQSTIVYEVPRAARVYPWSGVRAGTVRVQSGFTTRGNHVVPTLQIGYLQKHGLFITIRTPQGQRTALQIARSLRAAHK